MSGVEGNSSIMAERTNRELISEINALWADRLEAVPAGRIPRGVASDVAEFLTAVGLPTAEVQGIAFVHDERMSHLVEHLDRGYLLLATTIVDLPWVVADPAPFVVADPGDGRVGAFSGGRSPDLLFVNSSLPRFLVAQGVWRRDVWMPTVAGMRAEDGLAAYERFEMVLADLDPAASEAGAYWPVLLEGLREGTEL